MRGFVKTLFGDRRSFLTSFACILLAVVVLQTPFERIAGVVLPVALLAGLGYLAKH
jgi:hypothetical protein